MPTLNRRRWLTAAALTPVAGALIARAADVTSTSAVPSPRETIQARYLPNLVLRTQDDKEARFYDDLLKDKIVTINFIYSTCADGACPPDGIEFLRRNLPFTDVDPEIDKDPSRHSGNVRYGNEPLMQWAMCQGQATPRYIADSILWVVPKPA